MMLAKVDRKKAESVRRALLLRGALDLQYGVLREGDFVFFPLRVCVDLDGVEIVHGNAQAREEKPRSLRQSLEGRLSEAEMSLVPTSYTLVGDIAVLELPEELHGKAETVGKSLMESFPNVKVVALKTSQVEGEFRVPGLVVVAGEQRTETVHRENGNLIKVDVSKAYFNPRTGAERARVASKISEGEKVLVLFAGVGPYAVAAAKRTKAGVWAVELNPDAVRYLVENARLNKVGINVIEGDARDKVPDIEFDRVIMPLPKQAHSFIDVALGAVRDGGTIHYYSFAHNSLEASGDVVEIAGSFGYRTEIIDSLECGAYSPCLAKYCVDFRAWKIA